MKYGPQGVIAAFVIFVFTHSAAHAEDVLAEKIREVIDRPEYKEARWGMLIVDAKSGKTLFERNSEKLFLPASVTKLFSCAAALAAFGPDYRFTTPVYQRGEVRDGTLAGDLILVASGDLTFGGRQGKNGKSLFSNIDHTYANSGMGEAQVPDTNPLEALDDLAKQIAATGIKQIQGEILVDDHLFMRSRGSGSGPELLSPMIVNDNVVDIVVTPGKKVGQPATVRMRPESAFHHMDAEVTTGDPDKAPSLNLQVATTHHFSVRGEIAVNSSPVVRIFPVDEPILFARALFIEALRRQGIRLQASIYRPVRFDLPSRKLCAMLPRIAYYTSPPFAEAIKVTLKVSHNQYASTLPLLLAAKYDEQTLDQGLRRQGKILKDMGVPIETISLASGAGGANADAVTPRATVAVLQAMSKRPEKDAYFNALPVLGVDGTLAEVVAPKSPAVGKAWAKSGTLMWYDLTNDRILLRSKALAGKIDTKNGSTLFFALFLNDLPLPKGDTPLNVGKVLGNLCEIIYQNGP